MIIRRATLAWLLSLLLVFAQQGAVLHELGHLHGSATDGTSLRTDLHAPGSTSCPTCEAFAQLANPAAGTAPAVAVGPAAVLPTPEPCYAVIGADSPTPRSRGPPSV